MTQDKSFEAEIRGFFTQKNISFSDDSSSYDRLDFVINDKAGRPWFHFDVKEKRQRYNVANWPKFAAESDLFILDDLAVRKSLACSPRSGILIRDNLGKKYYFFSIIDLALMPRKRVNRSIEKNQPALKGKWLINLRNGKEAPSLESAFRNVRSYLKELNTTLLQSLECYGHYVDEEIDHGGIVRQPSHWDTDVRNTR